MDEKVRTSPFIALLHSRKFLVALLTIIVNMIGAALASVLPEVLMPILPQFLGVVTALGMTLIAAIAWEDGKAKELKG